MAPIASFSAAIAISLIISSANAGFGPNWGFYTPNPGFRQGPIIMSATTTLVLPAQPNPVRDQLALWPGIDTTGSDVNRNTGLVQALAISMPDPDKYCYHNTAPQTQLASKERVTNETATSGEWFVTASYFNNTSEQEMGGCAFAHPGDHIKMTYTYHFDRDVYDQKVRINGGPVVSKFESANSGSGYTWRVFNECQNTWSGTTPQQTYLNTKIVLKNPDPNFKRFIRKDRSTSTGLRTPDNGKTWHIKKITLFPGTCTPSSA